MITDLLKLTRPLVILDTETTGIDVAKDRIIEIGFRLHGPEGLKQWRSLINPGVPIPPESTEVHHITDAMVQSCKTCGAPIDGHPVGSHIEDTVAPCITPSPWPSFIQIAKRLAAGFTGCDFAGKRVRFDLQITAAEMTRSKVEWSYKEARVIDVDRLENLGEPRDLSALYKRRVGKDPVNAHSALDDVGMTEELLEAQLVLFEQLPRDLDELHALQWPGWIDAEGKFRRRADGVICCAFGKHTRLPIKKIPLDYWKYIRKSDFSAEIKLLAAEAMAGRFPQ